MPLSRTPRRLMSMTSDDGAAASSTRRPSRAPGKAEVIAAIARRDADGDGQHVVGQEGGGGDQPGTVAEVLAGDDVAAAAVRVGPDRLAVGDDDDRQDGDDQRGDRQRQPERAGPAASRVNRIASVA